MDERSEADPMMGNKVVDRDRERLLQELDQVRQFDLRPASRRATHHTLSSLLRRESAKALNH
jgi:hypothetical protein